MTPARDLALAELTAIATALAGFPDGATPAELAGKCGLPAGTVARRLANYGPNTRWPAMRWFWRDAVSGLWHLTDLGRKSAGRARA